MKTVTVFETAEEYFQACRIDRMKGDDSPSVPHTVYVVFDGDSVALSGEGNADFQLADSINQMDMTQAAFLLADTSVMFT